jgi:hemerythrin
VIPEIDLQHQFFLKQIIRFYNNLDLIKSKELINEHIDEILLYAKFHFHSEENLMKLIEYPEYEYHKKEHHKLIIELSDKITSYSIDEESIESILEFFTQWFNSHTATEDFKIADYLDSKQ